jgi:PAS domain S-box-containing protein
MNGIVFHHPALQVLLDSEEVAVFVHAPDFEACNATACRMLGVDRDALHGRSPFAFSPPVQPDGAPSAEALRRRMDSARAGQPQWFQWQFCRADGELVATLAQLEAQRFDGNDCLVTRVRNVSHLWNEEILRHAALAVSGAEGVNIFDQLVRSLATILKVDAAFIAVFADASGERLRTVGVCLDRQIVANVEYGIAGTPCADVVGRDFRYYPAQVGSQFPGDSMIQGLAVESYAGYPLNDAAGTPLGIVVVLSRSPLANAELTESTLKIFAVRAAAEIERGRAEAALRAREEQYRAIFNASVDGLLLKDSDHRIVDVNEAFLSMHGYRRDELIGQRLSAFIPAALQARCDTLLPGILAGEPCHIEAWTQRRDGTAFDIEIHGVPMQYRGRPHALVIMRDITEAKRAASERARLEAQLRQAQKMEAIGHLAGGIAHDFNNILTSIMGYIALATERDAAAGDEKLAKYLQQADLSCQRARDLIQQILTFSRGRKSDRQSVSLARLVGESENLLRASLPATLELASELDANAPPAMLDPVQAGQVLLNLCINARDATAGSGTVRLAVCGVVLDGVVCASCRQPVRGEFTELVVEDTGPGVAPGVMERMFEPFFTTKDVGKGSGMGLSTVHGIVHEHGGHMLVESTPGRGARFRVLFPALDRAQRDGGADAASPKSSRSRGPSLSGHVLVVDDEPMVGEFMRELLESWGLRVTVTLTGVEARDTFARDPSRFHAVITDQTMPRLTGLALARELLAVRPGLPVILYTGYSEGLTEVDAKAAGAFALVHKPVEPRALRALLESGLRLSAR